MKLLSHTLKKVVWFLVNRLVRLHYPVFVVEGREHLKGTGPALMLANHANSMLDAVLLVLATKRSVHYLAKAPLFKVPVLGSILRGLGMIPAFRGQDDRSSVKRNMESLDLAAGYLSDGFDVGIFPEGKSHDLPMLEQVRGGAARIAMMAYEKGAKEVRIIPIGLNYEEKTRFRSSVWIRIGKPIRVSEWLTRHAEEHPKKAIRQLTADMDGHLREVVIHLKEATWIPIVDMLESLRPPSKRRLRRDPIARLRQRARLARAINHFSESSDPGIVETGRALMKHHERLAGHGLDARSPAVRHRSVMMVTLLIWRTCLLMLGAVPMLFGTCFHVLPDTLARWLNIRYTRKQVGVTTVAMMRLVYGVPIYGIWYAGAWFGLAAYFMPWIANLCLVTAPLSGLFSLWYWRRFRRTFQWWCRDLRLVLNRSELLDLRREHTVLNGRLAELAAQYESVQAPLPEPPPFSWASFLRKYAFSFSVTLLLLVAGLSLNSWLRRGDQVPLLAGGPPLGEYSSETLSKVLGRDEQILHQILPELDRFRLRVDALQKDFLAGRRNFVQQADNDAIRGLMLDYLNYRSELLRIVWKYQHFAQVRDPSLRDQAGLICLAAASSIYATSLDLVTRFMISDEAVRKLNEPEPLWNIPEGIFDEVHQNIQNQLLRDRLLRALAQYERGGEHAFDRASSDSKSLLHARITENGPFIRNRQQSLLPGDPVFETLEDALKTGESSFYELQSAVSLFVSRLRVRDPRGDGGSLITRQELNELAPMLQPGDLIIQRRNWALSNAFMPGYWSHIAVYIGSQEQLANLGVNQMPKVAAHWERLSGSGDDGHPIRLIEALGEGVIFTSLEKSVGNADGVCVFRPGLTPEQMRDCLSNVFSHVGKPYDFNFDFFSTDKLVCTELVYRSFSEQIPLEVVEVMGRQTLPAMEVVRQFLEQDDLKTRVEFVVFLDGDESKGRAFFRGHDELKESLSRPSYVW